MERKILGSIFDRWNRNGINQNFEYLFQQVNTTNKQIDNLVINSGQSNAEVVQARAGKATLDARLRDMELHQDVVVSKTPPTNAHIWFEVE